jgi:hypothetical protein
MRFPRPSQHLIIALFGFAFVTMSAGFARAQEVTYYDFNVPQAANPSQTSGSCGSGNYVDPPAAGILFCTNQAGDGPSYFLDTYPPAIDPSNNPNGSMNYTVQLTEPTTNQSSSVWFSIPQDVVDGFNVWYAFKITPNPGSANTADGLAFVIQNSAGGGPDAATPCIGTGAGFTALGTGGGGCLGYGGIENSIALEADTFTNDWDAQDANQPAGNDNHIALQGCGPGLVNSPSHTVTCLITLGNKVSTLISDPNTSATDGNSTAVTLADGAPHQIVMVYNGPHDSPANFLSVYLDPQYNEGTHTPVAGTIPLFAGSFTITDHITTPAGGTAYVGFTAATGASFEQHELMGWTFTPHATVGQQQTLNNPGTPTTFNFGTHSYTTTFPVGTTTTGVGMGLIANTISPADFATLLGLGATQYSGSACQVYDDTGGNCIIYSVYCYDTGTNAVQACPAPEPPPTDCLSNPSAACIDLTAAYNNSIQPASPGYLQGDPLYSPVSTIQGDGTAATVTCVGECAVTAGQTITILGNSGGFNGTVTVATVPSANQFTFGTGTTGTGNGGFLTSNNVQDIFTGYTPQNIDGSTTGKTKNFSDFVVTAATTISSNTTLSPATASPTFGSPDVLTATITAPTTGGPGNVFSLLPPGPDMTLGGTVSFYVNSAIPANAISGCQTVQVSLVSTNYQAACSYTSPSTGPSTILAVYTGDAYHNGSQGGTPINVGLLVPQITWVPASIQLGTALTGAQLDASTTVAGTFVYTPLLGTVITNPTSQTLSVLFTPSVAGYATASKTVPLTVLAGPVATVSPTSINFGTLNFGSIVTKTVTVSNTGNAPMTISDPFIAIVQGGNSNEFITLNLCPKSLAVGKSCIMTVTFIAGPLYNPQMATLTVKDNAPGSPQTVTLSALVINPQATLNPSSLSFGTVKVNSSSAAKPITLSNPGGTTLSGISISKSGSAPNDYSFSTTCGTTLAAGKNCSISVIFKPTAKGSRTATLVVTDNAPSGTQKVSLTGTGN